MILPPTNSVTLILPFLWSNLGFCRLYQVLSRHNFCQVSAKIHPASVVPQTERIRLDKLSSQSSAGGKVVCFSRLPVNTVFRFRLEKCGKNLFH